MIKNIIEYKDGLKIENEDGSTVCFTYDEIDRMVEEDIERREKEEERKRGNEHG